MASPGSDQRAATKVTDKALAEQIDVVAEYHAHNIRPERIHYRTGIALALVTDLIEGRQHQALFSARLNRHRKLRRDQRLRKSLRHRGITQSDLQDRIEREYQQSLLPGSSGTAD